MAKNDIKLSFLIHFLNFYLLIIICYKVKFLYFKYQSPLNLFFECLISFKIYYNFLKYFFLIILSITFLPPLSSIIKLSLCCLVEVFKKQTIFISFILSLIWKFNKHLFYITSSKYWWYADHILSLYTKIGRNF